MRIPGRSESSGFRPGIDRCPVLQIIELPLPDLTQIDDLQGVFHRETPEHDAGYIVPVLQHRLAVDEGGGCDDAGDLGDLLHNPRIILHPARVIHDDDVGVDPQDLGPQVGFKAVHDGDDDDQGCDTQKDPGNRDEGDDGKEHLFPSCPKVAQADEQFIGHH